MKTNMTTTMTSAVSPLTTVEPLSSPLPPLSRTKARIRVARKGDALLPCKLASFRAPTLESWSALEPAFSFFFVFIFSETQQCSCCPVPVWIWDRLELYLFEESKSSRTGGI